MGGQKKRDGSPTLIARVKEFAEKRRKDLKALEDADLTAHTAHVDIGGQKVEFKINVERRAAWELYVELNTRIATQALKEHGGMLRKALDSLYDLFGITRGILKDAGPAVAQGPESVGFYAMELLNQVVRPVLDKWHPALSDWEEGRESGVSAVKHENKWARSKDLRSELESTRKNLIVYCDALAMLAGVSSELN